MSLVAWPAGWLVAWLTSLCWLPGWLAEAGLGKARSLPELPLGLTVWLSGGGRSGFKTLTHAPSIKN